MGDMLKYGDVVQFNEKHKWCGCLGFVGDTNTNNRVLVGVPMPKRGIAYIFADQDELEWVGKAALMPDNLGDEEGLNKKIENTGGGRNASALFLRFRVCHTGY